MPQKIFLIRHGETDHNLNGIVQGWLNTPLNATGRLQARLLAERFKDTPIHAIYSSDLKRAAQTARPLARLKQLKLITTPDLRERSLGIFEGKNWDQVRLDHPKLLDELHQSQFHPDWNKIKGESFRQLGTRIQHFISYLKDHHPGHTIAVITHGGTKRNILYHLGFHQESAEIHLGNTSLTTIVRSGNKYYLETTSDTSHLP